MVRTLALAGLAWSLFGADGRGVDGGAVGRDGGTPDAGAVDAGPLEVKASWLHADGGFFTDAGVSDVVVVPVGGAQEVRFPHPLVSGHCDDQDVARIEGTDDTLIFRGVVPGHTFCGFWFYEQPFPNRYLELTVVGEREAPAEQRRPTRPEFHR
ncbi:MAG: hypothetical protein IT380_24785 [Myxococcales bacterium]|nr:hypothetical protein [Myxococcales bacterium]